MGRQNRPVLSPREAPSKCAVFMRGSHHSLQRKVERVPGKMDFPCCFCTQLVMMGHSEQVLPSSKTQGDHLVWYKVL